MNNLKSKLCFLCEKIIQENNRINRNTLVTYMRYRVDELFKKFQVTVGDNIENYDSVLIHCTCYDKIKEKLDSICSSK